MYNQRQPSWLQGADGRPSHSVVLATIVSPERREVIALEPAFILPQDGEEKQDCESGQALA